MVAALDEASQHNHAQSVVVLRSRSAITWLTQRFDVPLLFFTRRNKKGWAALVFPAESFYFLVHRIIMGE